MLNVIVHWSKDIPVENLKQHKTRSNEHLYLVLRKRPYLLFGQYKPLYIGMAYRQSVYRRLKNHHKLKKIVKQQFGLGKIVIRIGQIELPSNNRISQDLVDDIESVLIINEQTRYNVVSKKNYKGRNIDISNKGSYRPLHRRVDSIKHVKHRYASGFSIFLVLLFAVALFYFSFSESGYQILAKWIDHALSQMKYLWNALTETLP
ncbi:MAG: hypothetical protein ACPGVB_04850 [Chitinophagales bacterium]